MLGMGNGDRNAGWDMAPNFPDLCSGYMVDLKLSEYGKPFDIDMASVEAALGVRDSFKILSVVETRSQGHSSSFMKNKKATAVECCAHGKRMAYYFAFILFT
jgi:hypothetical protein